uniref:Uncharacterized protein n=1 Tax=Arundo donax TaxID=35708 RepID=A0A0A8Y245_ARUDO
MSRVRVALELFFSALCTKIADTEDQPFDGKFLNQLPMQLELPESLKPSPHSSLQYLFRGFPGTT